ncbi:synaptobrevin family protein [Sporobolomyces koalae]|uniref:synaptobrevin family protein n=1 Tax=Sporobolomyces koalae TaxID=500713 RepID=UPI003179CFA3
MVRSTIIARATDGLPLAASNDDDEQDQSKLPEYKQQAKLIFRRLTPQSEPRCSIESGACTLHYLISDSIVYLTIADRSYPRKLAFSYLSELSNEFTRSYPPEMSLKAGLRPYAFVKFDTFIQRTKRLYLDPRGAEASGKGTGVASGLEQLNEDLQDVTRIMTKNMEDLLWRGDSLDRMSTMSSSLRDESLKYRKAAKKINTDALIRKWAPVGIAGLLFFVFVYYRFCGGLVEEATRAGGYAARLAELVALRTPSRLTFTPEHASPTLSTNSPGAEHPFRLSTYLDYWPLTEISHERAVDFEEAPLQAMIGNNSSEPVADPSVIHGDSLAIARMEREIAKMENERRLAGTPPSLVGDEGYSETSTVSPVISRTFSTFARTTCEADSPSSAKLITPQSSRKWSIVEVEDAYNRMKQILGMSNASKASDSSGFDGYKEATSERDPLEKPDTPALKGIGVGIPNVEVLRSTRVNDVFLDHSVHPESDCPSLFPIVLPPRSVSLQPLLHQPGSNPVISDADPDDAERVAEQIHRSPKRHALSRESPSPLAKHVAPPSVGPIDNASGDMTRLAQTRPAALGRLKHSLGTGQAANLGDEQHLGFAQGEEQSAAGGLAAGLLAWQTQAQEALAELQISKEAIAKLEVENSIMADTLRQTRCVTEAVAVQLSPPGSPTLTVAHMEPSTIASDLEVSPSKRKDREVSTNKRKQRKISDHSSSSSTGVFDQFEKSFGESPLMQQSHFGCVSPTGSDASPTKARQSQITLPLVDDTGLSSTILAQRRTSRTSGRSSATEDLSFESLSSAYEGDLRGLKKRDQAFLENLALGIPREVLDSHYEDLTRHIV